MTYHMRTLGGLAALLLFLSGFLGETPAEGQQRAWPDTLCASLF
jgi:hypothetical protein